MSYGFTYEQEQEMEADYWARADYEHELWADERRALDREAQNEDAYWAEQAEIRQTIEVLVMYRLARRGVFVSAHQVAVAAEHAMNDIPF